MSNQRRFFLTFLFIVIDIVLLVGFLVIRDVALRNVLKKEVQALSELDITKDRYNTPLKTNGSYKKIESAIKSYLDHDAVLLQDSIKIVKDPEFTSILSYANYEKDGPEFQSSLEYLNQSKEKFNQNIDTILLDLEEETMQEYISKRTNDKESCDLFMELMLSDSMKSDFLETKEVLTKTKARLNHLFDVSIQVLNFLVENKDNWALEEGEIRFQGEALYNQYVEYINSLNI